MYLFKISFYIKLKLNTIISSFKCGDLKGKVGSCNLPGESDYYNTKPFGDLEPVSPLPQPSTQRGFYNEEFEPLKFESDSM